MSNETYDLLKFIAQIFLPALATMCFTIAQVWGLPYAEEIVGTISAVDVFLGAILKHSSNKYYDEIESEEMGNGYEEV